MDPEIPHTHPQKSKIYCSIYWLENITLVAKKAGMYSILADETKDSSKEEQLPIVIRYVDVDTAEINERFLTYVKASSLNAEGLLSYILTALHDNGLDPSGIVSQVYDGASVMSGYCSGVQQRSKQLHLWLYTYIVMPTVSILFWLIAPNLFLWQQNFLHC